jgi:hypothetical protein
MYSKKIILTNSPVKFPIIDVGEASRKKFSASLGKNALSSSTTSTFPHRVSIQCYDSSTSDIPKWRWQHIDDYGITSSAILIVSTRNKCRYTQSSQKSSPESSLELVNRSAGRFRCNVIFLGQCYAFSQTAGRGWTASAREDQELKLASCKWEDTLAGIQF